PLDQQTFQCRACEESLEGDEFVTQALDEHFAGDAFEAAKGGEPGPLADCPECLLCTYVVEEDACPRCGHERDYTESLRCNEDVGSDEQELSGLCGYCAHVMGKDD